MNSWMSIGLLVVLFVAMYFFMIRPQKKKEKKIAEMRDNLQPGDEIITIGGFIGKVVSTKDDTVVVQIGADKQRAEMMRWAISEVKSRGTTQTKKETETSSKPKRLKKAQDEEGEKETKTTAKKTTKTTTKKTTTKKSE